MVNERQESRGVKVMDCETFEFANNGSKYIDRAYLEPVTSNKLIIMNTL